MKAELLVVRAVPQYVAKRGQGDRRQPLCHGPRNDLIDERTSDTATSMFRRDRQLVEVAFAVDDPCHREPDDRSAIVGGNPGSLFDGRPLEPSGPVRRSVRTARDPRILDSAEPFSGRDLGRPYPRHIVDGRQSNNDWRTPIHIRTLPGSARDRQFGASAGEAASHFRHVRGEALG